MPTRKQASTSPDVQFAVPGLHHHADDAHDAPSTRSTGSGSPQHPNAARLHTNGDSNANANEPPRTGRACLACRKLKTKCDGADEPPCKRCKAGGLECVFVESKRGKRPARKPVELTLSTKFGHINSTLSSVLSSIQSGATPTADDLHKLQATLKEGIEAGRLAEKGKGEIIKVEDGDEQYARREVYRPDGNLVVQERATPDSDDQAQGSTKGRKRAKTTASIATSLSLDLSHPPHISPSQQFATPLPPLDSNFSPHSTTTPSLSQTSLSVLVDASLAAEIDGRSQLTGLNENFKLSSITNALNAREPGGGPRSPGTAEWDGLTPRLLADGTISAETAVEMFRIFFEDCYIHIPLLDPSTSTPSAIAQKSPFLFTAILAVASRFHPDPTLHQKCYDEAHRWLYFGMAVRMALELGLFRPPSWVDAHLAVNGHKPNPWINLPPTVTEDEQREALNRERTWLICFVIDRNMSAVMGRPYQIQEAKPLLLPLHPMSLPFDLGIIAHQELQSIIGQVMDTFRDRIYGLSSASDDMPSPVVMKMFNSRMDDWKARWCPVAGEPIANNLQFYFFSSKLFLNTFPLQTILRQTATSTSTDDPTYVSSTISSAISILTLSHSYATLGVLLHCPDVNFLLLLYAAVFLIKMKASNSQFTSLVNSEELEGILSTAISDCGNARGGAGRNADGGENAAGTCEMMLKALLASWRAMERTKEERSREPSGVLNTSVAPPASAGLTLDLPPNPFSSMSSYQNLHSTLGSHIPPSPAPYSFPTSTQPGTGHVSGTQTPSNSLGLGLSSLGGGNGGGLEGFLNDTNFFHSVLVSQGADGFFAWDQSSGWDGGLDLGLGGHGEA
ncbi:Zn(2)-C6 transcription factor [Pseudohyphozyma bogoriensis]|nr:Zn(2)-C6 transcription factor [Pseudohyphozyma bogoriensis]